MSIARSTHNPAFPADWTPSQIDGALQTWRAQAAPIKAQLAISIEARKAADEQRRQLEAEKLAAWNWCRANGNPHLGGAA